jgi:hypothetical protein
MSMAVSFVCCKADQNLEGIWKTLYDKGSENFKQVIDDKEKYELQIRYTEIKRDENNNPLFRNHGFNLDSTHYFYPASTVKMQVAVLALEKLKDLRSQGYNVNKDTPLHILTNRKAQTSATSDSTSHNLQPSIGHYIKKIFAVSDNDAYVRLYEFLGRDYINKKLLEKAIFTNSRIVTRVGISGFSYEENAFTNPYCLLSDTDTLYHQAGQKSTGNYIQELHSTIKGIGYYNDSLETVVMEAFDMREKNFISLQDHERTLQRIFFPEFFKIEQRFNIEIEDYTFLRTCMHTLPRQWKFPEYNPEEYYDAYVKFFVYGDTKENIPSHIKIYNKVGYAYGTLTDIAYIQDTLANKEFFLCATLLVNENKIFNDGIYEYDSIGIPFLAELGRLLLED